MFKGEKGITLVALVITIIVLLILAGVSLSLVVGQNGVLTQSTTAVKSNKTASAKQALNLGLASMETRYYAKWVANQSVTRDDEFLKYDLAKELENQGYELYLDGTAAANKVPTTGNRPDTLPTAADDKLSCDDFTVIYVKSQNGKDTFAFVLKIDKITGKVEYHDDTQLNAEDKTITWTPSATSNQANGAYVMDSGKWFPVLGI